MFGFEGTKNKTLFLLGLAQWLSWLERRPVTAEVVGSSPIWVVNGVLAQLGEHLPYKQRVIGSSPIGPIFLPFFIKQEEEKSSFFIFKSWDLPAGVVQ